MSQDYRIVLHIKALRDFETSGEFFVGTSRSEATRLFNTLKGTVLDVLEGIVIMELRTIYRGLPIESYMLGCTMDELGENCTIITQYLSGKMNI